MSKCTVGRKHKGKMHYSASLSKSPFVLVCNLLSFVRSQTRRIYNDDYSTKSLIILLFLDFWSGGRNKEKLDKEWKPGEKAYQAFLGTRLIRTPMKGKKRGQGL